MRHLIALFLSVFLCFNAAYAAVTDICDLVEHGSKSEASTVEQAVSEHFGHHSHHHDHPVADLNSGEAPDQNSQVAHSDHCHPHQCFTSLLPSEISLPPLEMHDLTTSGSTDKFVSPSLARPERPPRTVLA